MKLVVFFHLFLLLLIGISARGLLTHSMPLWLEPFHAPIVCALLGGIGGVIYCLRGVYLNACVRKQWDDVWKPWYYIRPIVSVLCGGMSYLFLKAGLLVLEAKETEDSRLFGFYALAFIAGLNVDKFIIKIENVAQASWGIDKSRASEIEIK